MIRYFKVTTSYGKVLSGYTQDERTFQFPSYANSSYSDIIEAKDEHHALRIWEDNRKQYYREFLKYIDRGGRDWD